MHISIFVTINYDYTIGDERMKACGVIVEYNPFHKGHLYHLQKARSLTNADCMVAVMSGPFLQRGEPAIIDKFHRAKAALQSGADIVIELPHAFAVQSSELFAKGALLSLDALQVQKVCFGSESGQIDRFIKSYERLKRHESTFTDVLRSYLHKGYSYPEASNYAYKTIGMDDVDMIQPNNILGFSYVRTIFDYKLTIKPYTIKRIASGYHDAHIASDIASATSIRNELLRNGMSEQLKKTMPQATLNELQTYKRKATRWHTWEQYFPLLRHQMMTMTTGELRNIHGVTEGIEFRIQEAITKATSFDELLNNVKTKRYTQTRLQRLFVHILLNNKKATIAHITNRPYITNIRLLGMTSVGQRYLRQRKKSIHVPIWTQLNKANEVALAVDEKAMNVYYSILPPERRNALRSQEFTRPIIIV